MVFIETFTQAAMVQNDRHFTIALVRPEHGDQCYNQVSSKKSGFMRLTHAMKFFSITLEHSRALFEEWNCVSTFKQIYDSFPGAHSSNMSWASNTLLADICAFKHRNNIMRLLILT